MFCAISSDTKIKSIAKTSLNFLNNSDQFFLDKCFTGVHDTERQKPCLCNFELDIIDLLHNKLKNRNRNNKQKSK